MQIRRLLGSTVFAAALAWSQAAGALTLTVPTRDSSLVGEPYVFEAVVTEASGSVHYYWDFSDGTPIEDDPTAAQVTHTYAKAGSYATTVRVTDDGGGFDSLSFAHIAHHPLTAKPPTSSASIVYDAARTRVYVVNQDNDSITSIDTTALMNVAELAVYRRPEALALAPSGKLWVVHRDDYAVAVVDPDTFSIERGFRLPYASQPMGIAFSPAGDAVYITLMALGQLLKLDPTTGEVVGTLDVGPMPRGVAVSADGKAVYVTRFISPSTGGEVVQIDGATFSVAKRIALTPDTTTPDSDQGGRGLPNYLFGVQIAPDGLTAWVPAKKDNIFRGNFIDAQALNKDNTVRPLVSVLDLGAGAESLTRRIDLDDRSLPIHVSFSAQGEFGFVTLAGSNMVEIRGTDDGVTVATVNDAAMSPRATLVDAKNHLFVQSALGRNVNVFDLDPLLSLGDHGTPVQLADIKTVKNDAVDPQILQGKRIFNSAADSRMAPQGYLTCAVCHFDGFEDGRVYDFTSRGEGLRNTTSLLGRRGTGQGPVHWSGNFDEIQDFEQEIRELFSGHGFIPDDVLSVGTRSQPLGDPKKGLSPELDALAAYVTSLDHVDPSPFKNADGSLTADGAAGKALFGKLGCDFCHSGKDFTDSARGRLHDVGTLLPSSGSRSGAPLLGIDTPTLLGIWQTAPYLHDGSAPTLRDVLVTKNPNDQHGFVSSLKPEEIDQLVSYLQQIDSDEPQRRLPFEPALPATTGGLGGGGAGGSLNGGAPNQVGGQPAGGAGGLAGAVMAPKTSGCTVAGSHVGSAPSGGFSAFLALAAALFVRKRRAARV